MITLPEPRVTPSLSCAHVLQHSQSPAADPSPGGLPHPSPFPLDRLLVLVPTHNLATTAGGGRHRCVCPEKGLMGPARPGEDRAGRGAQGLEGLRVCPVPSPCKDTRGLQPRPASRLILHQVPTLARPATARRGWGAGSRSTAPGPSANRSQPEGVWPGWEEVGIIQYSRPQDPSLEFLDREARWAGQLPGKGVLEWQHGPMHWDTPAPLPQTRRRLSTSNPAIPGPFSWS